MSKLSKFLIGGGIIGTVAFLIMSKVGSLQTAWRLLQITPKIDGGLNSVKINLLSGITVPVAVDFGNRTDQQITVQINALDAYYKGKALAGSAPSAKEITVKPNSISTLTGITLNIPVLSLISTIGDVVTSILAEGNLSAKFANLLASLEIDVTATVNRTIVVSARTALGQSVEVKNNGSVGALGLVAASERKLKPFSDYSMLIPPKSELQYTDLTVRDGEVEDTISLMHQIASKYQGDTQALANYLKGNNLRETVKNFFDFVYNYIQYVPDSISYEQLRRPLRTLYDRKGDCDCYSILIASMCNNLNIPYKFRIAAYTERQQYQHVYVVVPSANGDLVCDPVVDAPFYEKPPVKFQDFLKPKGLK